MAKIRIKTYSTIWDEETASINIILNDAKIASALTVPNTIEYKEFEVNLNEKNKIEFQISNNIDELNDIIEFDQIQDNPKLFKKRPVVFSELQYVHFFLYNVEYKINEEDSWRSIIPGSENNPVLVSYVKKEGDDYILFGNYFRENLHILDFFSVKDNAESEPFVISGNNFSFEFTTNTDSFLINDLVVPYSSGFSRVYSNFMEMDLKTFAIELQTYDLPSYALPLENPEGYTKINLTTRARIF